MQWNCLVLVFFTTTLGCSFMCEFLPYLWYGFLTNGVSKTVLLPVVVVLGQRVKLFICYLAVVQRLIGGIWFFVTKEVLLSVLLLWVFAAAPRVIGANFFFGIFKKVLPVVLLRVDSFCC